MYGLALLGLSIGFLGSLVGVGGGFILMPILFYIFPEKSPESLTAISMAAIFLNALSGTGAYLRHKQINLKIAIPFAIAAAPGSYFGAYVVRFLHRESYELGLGIFMLCAAALLFWRNRTMVHADPSKAVAEIPRSKFNLGMLISTVVGFLSSLLGIGGGIVQVPALVYVLKFPVRIATATSLFVLASSSFVAVLQHLSRGTYAGTMGLILPIGIGVVIGAQFGAHFSGKVKSKRIMDVLVVLIVITSLKLIF